jgi:CheY-like chemotaxis protein
LLVDLLAGRGYVVRTTDTALGVVALAQRERPSAILLDLGLPYRSGAALLADLKDNQQTAPIPVIVVSAYAETLSSYRAALAAAVLPKPFDTQVLFDAVEAACA